MLNFSTFTAVLNKEQHIEFWVKNAEEDWETAVYNKQGKRNTAALFFLHLVIEKLLKAIWIKSNVSNTPPFTHDLVTLANQCDIDLSADWFDYLSAINRWNIEGRYPDYKMRLHNIATEAYLQMHTEKVASLKKWLLSKI